MFTTIKLKNFFNKDYLKTQYYYTWTHIKRMHIKHITILRAEKGINRPTSRRVAVQGSCPIQRVAPTSWPRSKQPASGEGHLRSSPERLQLAAWLVQDGVAACTHGPFPVPVPTDASAAIWGLAWTLTTSCAVWLSGSGSASGKGK